MSPFSGEGAATETSPRGGRSERSLRLQTKSSSCSVGLVQARCGFVGLSAEFDDGGKLSVAILADAEVETLFEVRDQGLEKLIAI